MGNSFCRRAICLFFLLSLTLSSHRVIAQQADSSSRIFESFNHAIRVTSLAEGLANPWSLALLPDGDMLVTERPGQLRLIHNGELVAEPITGTPEVSYRNHGGLMDIVLHPDFENNRLVYLSYSRKGELGATTAVLRARFDGSSLLDAEDIFVADAWSPRDINFGSRVAFDNDGFLYITVGDRGPDGEALAQDLSVHNGKIIRLHDDGSIPEDNPFVGVANAKADIYSYGHRNPQGLVLHPQNGEMWATEHGPRGGDEVNILKPGANYGWPLVSFGRTYPGEIISTDPMREGTEPPRFFWVPSIGISGLLIYYGEAFPEWQNKLMVTGMSGMMFQTVVLEGRASRERESMLTELRYEIRDIREDASGRLYLVVRQDAARTKNSGKILLLEPAD